jgi:hypothetical protein
MLRIMKFEQLAAKIAIRQLWNWSQLNRINILKYGSMAQESSEIIILKDEIGLCGPRGPCACVCFHRLSARWLANAGGSFCRRKIGLDTLKRAEILHKRRRSARETDRHSLSIELRNSVRIIIIRVHAVTLAQWRADFCLRSFHCGIA